MRDRVAYLHLPKAAGTSFRHAIAAYFDAEDTVPWSFDRHLFGDFDRLGEVTEPVFLGDESELQGYRYMEGHWTLPTMLSAFDAADVVCTLREPRSRLLSHYTFWRSWPDWMHDLWQPYDAARSAQLSLGEYCRSDPAAHQADNLVARLVIGPHDLIPLGRAIDPAHWDELSSLGCALLDSIGHVDVLERGDATYEALEVWCGASLDRRRLNETDLDDGPPVDLDDLENADTLALVEQRTAIDSVLWRHAARLRGVDPVAATELADRTFRAARDKVKLQAAERVATERAEAAAAAERAQLEAAERTAAPSVAAQSDGDVLPNVSVVARLAALVRRGPRAVAARVIAQFRRRH